ncbi:hypothetical protein [Rugosimonospora africana]|uniref:SCP-2 sterol transfer family protein n=1 Tax=Rugosimonospora africana TaxID=556532 RepID=A0A8J3QTQ3_9ACTN|nr:hypothetical protein [Rugosimonospora africana]GIH15635.1 hypothetical protein Raf01_38070 [Rugosimonospora africana]
MAGDDLIDAFFNELSQRGHDPLLDRLSTTGRVEICDGDHTRQWVVTVRDGCASLTADEPNIGWVLRAERTAFNQLVSGEVSALESLMRGSISFTLIDESQRFSLLSRLFAGSPETRIRRGPLVHTTDVPSSGEPA